MTASFTIPGIDADRLRETILARAAWLRARNLPWKTGIYPAEMAAFLGFCDAAGVRGIVESGRGPDAYSTQILGAYGDETGARVASMDMSPPAKHHYGEALSKHGSLRCVTGNAFSVLPRAFRKLPSPAALLVDGPKMQQANRLSLSAALLYEVRVVAHHNCPLDAPWGKEFLRIFPGAFHFEELGLDAAPAWKDFRAWERQATGGYETEDTFGNARGRSLELSSLAMAVVPDRTHLERAAAELENELPRLAPRKLLRRWKLRSFFGF